MNNISPEKIIILATSFSLDLCNKCSKDELALYKLFFQTVLNNIQSIITTKK